MKAAIYVRSSKDRSEVSILAQRRELQQLATARNLAIVEEFSDTVESAKDERRPGFQSLLRSLRRQDRGWSHLLVVDTSRLSRRQYMAQVFAHECRRQGIEIVYSKVPTDDPLTAMIVTGVLQVFDELHSVMSREKGLAGMRENVRLGYRAGGRAPRGYRLRHLETGTIRDGEPVRKSVLEPNEDAERVRTYLQARAAGTPRKTARERIAPDWPSTSLVAMEWQALTYAGHTVWNMHRPRLSDGGYEGGQKRRPREEWEIKQDTHPALITTEEAESLIRALQSSPWGGRRRVSKRLLSGLLFTPDGHPWYGWGRDRYRVKNPNGSRGPATAAVPLERSIVAAVCRDLRSPRFLGSLVRAAKARRATQGRNEALEAAVAEIREMDRRIARLTDVIPQTTEPAPLLRQIESYEGQRRDADERRAFLEAEAERIDLAATMSEQALKRTLTEFADQLEVDDGQPQREVLGLLVERVELDPDTLTGRIDYRIRGKDDTNMASPRDHASSVIGSASSGLTVSRPSRATRRPKSG